MFHRDPEHTGTTPEQVTPNRPPLRLSITSKPEMFSLLSRGNEHLQ
jgi:hypothetical protein